MSILENDPALRAVLEAIADGTFSPEDPSRHLGVVNALTWGGDHYCLLADYAEYVATQQRVDTLFRDRDAWAAAAIRNVAGMGVFSSDRAIGEYARRIWRVQPRR
jgi:starch phosphorylase